MRYSGQREVWLEDAHSSDHLQSHQLGIYEDADATSAPDKSTFTSLMFTSLTFTSLILHKPTLGPSKTTSTHHLMPSPNTYKYHAGVLN
jgi:hypothetical protein